MPKLRHVAFNLTDFGAVGDGAVPPPKAGLEALRNIVDGFSIFKRVPVRAMPKLRHVAFNLTDFGAVGDGVTLNTEAFEKAVLAISKLGKKGGGQPNMPHGR
ncbi:unnamed protein product [Prunus armeniaca]|uniref:Uncharacterized protein n=1 Tax=Prunus armeniaca TaxID=36596 RepID=A0A6J5VV58_PRUAR|nr:unnamed protein product [Prunus armeniaca]